MALQNVDILAAWSGTSGKRMKPLRVDGGAAANDLLMQTQADYLGRKLVRPRIIETTVAGASYLAGLGRRAVEGHGGYQAHLAAGAGVSVKPVARPAAARRDSWQQAVRRRWRD
jgi:glycerol kinase